MTGEWAGFEGTPALAGSGSGAVAPTPATAPIPTGVTVPPSATALLNRCDVLFGEIGRRMHRFSWLRAAGAPIEQCLVVDAYFPGNRVVVVCGTQTAEEDELCAVQVPAHGLRLLRLQPEQFASDPGQLTTRLADAIRALGPVPPRPQEPVPRSVPPRHVAPSLAPAPTPARPPTPLAAARWAADRARASTAPDGKRAAGRTDREQQERAGLVLGVTLVVVLAVEMMIFVAIIGFGGGHPVLAIGFAFDVGSRALGTIAFARDGDEDRAWGALIVGSPAVVGYTLVSEEPITTEPAPLAGWVGALAIVLIVVAGLAAVL